MNKPMHLMHCDQLEYAEGQIADCRLQIEVLAIFQSSIFIAKQMVKNKVYAMHRNGKWFISIMSAYTIP